MAQTVIKTYDAPRLYEGLEFDWAVRTDVGHCRTHNEDSYSIEPEIGLFLISDGMGGHRGGELASGFVSETLSVQIETGLSGVANCSAPTLRKFLSQSIILHNKEVHSESISEAGIRGMGATLVLCLVHNGRAYAANLGDSRLYRLRNNRLKLLTRDHTVVSELIEAGLISIEAAFHHETRGQITQYMGMPEAARPHLHSFALKPFDRLLLCSDGLTDMLPDARIREVISLDNNLENAADILVQEANEAGGHDNTTVILVEYHGIS